MKQKNNGFVFVEFIFVIISVIIVLAFFLPTFSHVSKCCRGGKCKANLTQIRTALTLYQLDFGRQVYYPPQDGGQFIAVLYAERLLVEECVYVCPSTGDIVDGGQLADVTTGQILVSTSAIGTITDARGPLSYAGRINGTTGDGNGVGDNTSQNFYPGFFKLSEDVSVTPMICDDVADSNATGSENHEGGTLINVLFLDGHVDHIRRKNGIVNDKSLFGVATGNGDAGLLNPMAN